MSARSHRPSLDRRFAAQLLTLVLAYLVTGHLGLKLSHFHETATLIWAPTGLSLAALLLYGYRLWPGIFAGALLVNVGVGLSPVVSLLIAAGNTLEAVLGTWLLHRFGHFQPQLSRQRDVVVLVVYGGLLCTLVSAAVGVATVSQAGGLGTASPGDVFLIWWLGDFGGAIIVAPILLVARYGTPHWKNLLTSVEFWSAIVGLIAVCTLAFGGLTLGPWSLLAAFMPFPFLIWAGSRLGSRGAILCSGVTALLATLGTSLGHGPFLTADAQISQLLLLAYMTTVAASAMALASATHQRNHAERQRQLEAERNLRLEQSMNQAQRLKGLGTLAGGIAHDFNNILTVIRANAELLSEDLSESDDAQQSLCSIEEAADRAADLCSRLMAYAGQSPPAKQVVSLVDVAQETLSMLAPSLSKKVTLRTVLSGAAPSVDGDMTLLRQVLMNLVLNGAEAIGEDEGTVEVRVGTARLSAQDLATAITAPKVNPGTFACIEVVDSGTGVDTKTAQRMFDPFYTTKPGGRGLGLAAVLGIVRSHGGALSVHGEPGRGTTIRLSLPALEDVPQAMAPSPPGVRSAAPMARDGERVILLADDEPELLRAAAKILVRGGHRVLTAGDGAQAVDAFREHSGAVKLALLDMTMPSMSGVEAMVAIRALDPAVPVLLMSGFSANDTEEIATGDGFLAKPFSSHDLLALVDQALALKLGFDESSVVGSPEPAQ